MLPYFFGYHIRLRLTQLEKKKIIQSYDKLHHKNHFNHNNKDNCDIESLALEMSYFQNYIRDFLCSIYHSQ